MPDFATPNLPSRDFEETSRFYGRLGFEESWRDGGWMILKRGGMTVEFFSHPDLDPDESWSSCCFRMDDVEVFFAEVVAAGVPETGSGRPRAHRPRREAWGGLVGALVRLVQVPG